MEIMTQVLVLVAVARAGVARVEGAGRWGFWMVLAAGLAGNLDELSAWMGAEAYFRWNRTVTHSAVSGVVTAVVVAGIFWWLGRRDKKRPVRLGTAAVVCAAGVAGRMVVDLAGSEGVRLLWPTSGKFTAWDLVAPIDPWILVGMGVALVWPLLLGLVTDEIGAKRKKGRVDKGAVAALVLLTVYLGGRAMIHGEAVRQLDAVVYRGAIAKKVAAFPMAGSPMVWRGMAETANTFEEVEVNVGKNPAFEPEKSRTIFKPEGSEALVAAGRSKAVQAYAEYARFAKAAVEKMDAGWRVTVRDLRFEGERRRVMLVVMVDGAGRVMEEEFEFEGGG